MKVAVIGGGTIGRLILEHVSRGELGSAAVVGIMGRGAESRGKPLAAEFGVEYVTGVEALIALRPDVVVEAASHDAVRDHAEAILHQGTALIVLSGGALCDDALRSRLEHAAQSSGGLLYVPSGGIGGLDALKAACMSGAESVTITVSKPPAAWKNIEYVVQQHVNLDALREPRVLFEGPARGGVPLFPANVNIAAVLSMAGIGFDRTRLKVVADPALRYNTHTIDVKANTGNIRIQLENVPDPANPKTAWLACYSALAAIRLARANVRYGT
jgi:aspartate dehydrogenase